MKRFLSLPQPTIFALLAALVFSLVCTRIPLLNYLGFEFSALTAVVGGLLAGLMTIALWSQRGSAQSRSHNSDADMLGFLKMLAGKLLLLFLIPLVILSANALFVKNCSFTQGLFFYSVLVLPSMLFCASLAMLLAAALDRWRKTWFVACWLLLLAHIAVVTFTGPQIYAFNPIVGFFPGITYDETLAIEGRLILYRWTTLAAAMVLMIGAVILQRVKLSRTHKGTPLETHQRPFHPVELAGAMMLTSALVVVWLASDRLGFSTSKDALVEHLSGRLETEHFVIVYPRNAVNDQQVRMIAGLHEFYFERLVRELGVVSVRKIHSFLYTSAEEKGRLIGAGGTNIAKPWLWQVHVNLADVERSLKHELVHVLAAEFGFPLLRVGLNAGLIEGLAMAVERTAYHEPIHRVAAQIIAIEAEPNMERLFSWTGFMRAHPAVSYTIAGSFCRYLIDRYGMRRFRRLYRTGSFQTSYNKDITALVDEWKRFLNRYSPAISGEGELEKARFLFTRQTIFGKECARVIANRNAETERLLKQKQYEPALAAATHALELSFNADALRQRMTALMRLGRYDEAIALAQEHLSDSSLARTLYPVRLLLGDALWANGDTTGARRVFGQLAAVRFSPTWEETVAIRLEALESPLAREVLLFYFVSDMGDTLRIELLRRTSQDAGARNIALFLLGREHAARGEHHKVIDALLPINRMESDRLELTRQLRLARAYLQLGQTQRAMIHYWQALNFTANEAELMQIREWLDWCEWLAQRARRPAEGIGS